MLGAARERGNDIADIEAELRRLEAGDQAAPRLPALGRVAQRRPGPPRRSALLGASYTQRVGPRPHHAGQHVVAGEAEDVADSIGFAPGHRLGPAAMAVAAHPEGDLSPAAAGAPRG